ncbi:hypothetical protein D9M71_461660 [compost metagenome]
MPGGGVCWKYWRMPLEIERARACWCDTLASFCDSPGLEMKPVSTRIDGMSGDFSTMKPACSTRRLCSEVMRPTLVSTLWPTSRLEDMVAVIDRSSSTPASMRSLSSRLTPPSPPIRSERFSVSASQRAVSEVAPRSDRANTDAPKALRLGAASAWMETNRSAPFLRAISVRLRNGMK